MTEQREARPRIVVGVDGSDHSKLALRWAARMAAAESAEIHAVSAWDYPVNYGSLLIPDDYAPRVETEKVLTKTVDEVFGPDRPPGLRLRIAHGRPAAVLVQESETALVIVVGSRGHGGFVGLLLGSVSGHVAEYARCPVLVVHGHGPSERKTS